MTWQAVTTRANLLGESPFWHPQEQMLYWVDIAAKTILRCNVFMGTVETWPMAPPHELEPGCIAPALGGGLVMALRDGVYRARHWGGALECLHRFAHDNASTRANDGKCDALGRFWVGSVDEAKVNSCAELISLDCRANGPALVRHHAGGALTGNGLAWSPDKRTLYWSDTSRHVIYAWGAAIDAAQLGAALGAAGCIYAVPLGGGPGPSGFAYLRLPKTGEPRWQARPLGPEMSFRGALAGSVRIVALRLDRRCERHWHRAPGFQQRPVDLFEAHIDRQNGKGDPGMRQSQHHRGRAVEQEIKRLVDQPQLDEAGIDDAVEAQHDLPGKDTQQVAGPDRHRDEDQP